MKSMSKKVCVSLMASLMFVMAGCTSEESPVSKSTEEEIKILEKSEENQTEITEFEKENSFIPSYEESNQTVQIVPEIKTEKEVEYVPEIKQEEEHVQDIPACDDTIPYGAFTDRAAASQYAQSRLDQLANADWDHWNQGGYYVDTMANGCGTLYYTVRLYRWEGNTKVFE